MEELDLFNFVAATAYSMPDHVFTEPDDDWAPILFMDGPDGRSSMLLSDWMETDQSKDVLVEMLIPGAIRHFKATTVVMVLSNWTSKTSGELLQESGEYVPPSQQPDREEGVMVVEYTREGVTRQAWAPIQRFPDKVPRLGEWSKLDALGVEGRFVTPIVKALKAVRA